MCPEQSYEMSEMFVNDGHSATAEAQLSRQPTVDMGTPVDLLNAAVRLDGDGRGVASTSMPPLLYSQLQTDDISSMAVRTGIGELKPVDSMPHLTPMTSDTGLNEKKDIDTDDWVPMVSQKGLIRKIIIT